MDELFRRLEVPLPKLPANAEARPEAVLRVMALASFADWVASDPGFFPYGRDPCREDYLEEALELAKKALDRLGWRPFRPSPKQDFSELFPFPPNPLQGSIPEVLGNPREPVLLLVEAPMGMGKTEAALYAHHLLQQTLEHRGFYVALPTQATANGLFPRVRAFLERLAEGETVELQLQHGAAILNPEYEFLLECVNPVQIWNGQKESEEGGAVASVWERPLAVGAHRHRWFYVCSFVEPETGESLSLLVDGMDTEVISWVLRELRAWLGEGEEAWVVLDRAGWHVSGKVEVPEGVRLVFLPPIVRSYSRWSGCGPW